MTIPTKEDFATEVRADRLTILYQATILGGGIAASGILVAGVVNRSQDLFAPTFAIIMLITSCLITRVLLKRNRFVMAVWVYAMGGMITNAILLAYGDTNARQIVPFVYPVIIFIVGLLLPSASALIMTVIANIIIVLTPVIATGSWSVLGIHQFSAIILMYISALLAAQVTGELYQITEWALMNYQRQRRTNDQLFEKREELQRSLRRSEALSQKLKETNLELEAAHAAAEEAKHFRGQFLANMSHELRTPLNAIIGFSETMLKFPLMYDNTPLPALYDNDLGQIYNSGRQLLHVINDILDLAKVDAGKLEVHMEKVNPMPVVLAAMSTAKGLIGGKSIQLEKDLVDPMPTLWADETRLRQVLLNLYSNACKFTDEGKIKLTVREVEDTLQFSLQDTGCGIAPEHLGLIFEEFKQASTAGRDPRAGAGLGLAISRQLLDLMGGRIWVESKLGEGSTFHFTVQIYRQQNTPAQSAIQEDQEMVKAKEG